MISNLSDLRIMNPVEAQSLVEEYSRAPTQDVCGPTHRWNINPMFARQSETVMLDNELVYYFINITKAGKYRKIVEYNRHMVKTC